MSKLKLDFQLETAAERSDFLNKIQNLEDLSDADLEMCGNYILWGRDPDGKNSHQKKIVRLPSSNKAWDRDFQESQICGSFDQLIETYTKDGDILNREIGTPFSEATRLKIDTSEKFSRDLERKRAPALILKELESLWNQIDLLDFEISYAQGRAIREQLQKFNTPENQKTANSFTPYELLKKRKLLIEMRRQQFNLRDSYSTPIMSHSTISVEEPRRFELEVFPFGVPSDTYLPIFIPFSEINPSLPQKKEISNFLWEKERLQKTLRTFFDFQNPSHIAALLNQFSDLEDAAGTSDTNILEAFNYYFQEADLTDVLRLIVNLKIKKKKNEEIVSEINKQFSKTYTINYISTLYKQKALPKIAEAARIHKSLISEIFFEEEWRTCTKCGRTLLLNEQNFTHNKYNSQGFNTQCKKCQKERRNSKK